jgi:peptide subunit release factor 1 (eRF1)
MVCEALVPRREIGQASYVCDKRFHAEEYEAFFREDDSSVPPHGLVWGTGEDIHLYFLANEEKAKAEEVGSLSVHRQKGQKKGGQSAARFGRIHDNQIAAFAKLVAETCNRKFLTSEGIPNICSLTFGGVGGQVSGIYSLAAKSPHLSKNLSELIVDKPLPSKSIEHLINLSRSKREKVGASSVEEFVRRFTEDVERGKGRAVYGPEQLLKHANTLDTILCDAKTSDARFQAVLEQIGPKTKRLDAHSSPTAKALLQSYGPAVALAFFAPTTTK